MSARELLQRWCRMRLIARLVAPVVVAFSFRSGMRSPGRTGGALLIGLYAAYVVVEGFTLAVVEEAHSRYGVTTSGIVLSKLSTTGENGSTTIGYGRRMFGPRPRLGRGPTVRTIKGFALHQALARLILTGTHHAWVIDYRYTCLSTGRTCVGRDFIPHDRWTALPVGAAIDVRQVQEGIGSSTSHMEGNDARATALVEVLLGGAALAIAAFAAGAFSGTARKKLLEAPATVLGVTPVQYRDSTCWHVRFAFFDRSGEPHEVTDEFVTTTWKVGDAGIAKYDAANPRVAALGPADSVGP